MDLAMHEPVGNWGARVSEIKVCDAQKLQAQIDLDAYSNKPVPRPSDE
jgi:hypothetical protein